MAFDKKSYDMDWKKANKDRIALNIPKGNREKWQSFAKAHGTTVSHMIAFAVKQCYGFDILEKSTKEEGD